MEDHDRQVADGTLDFRRDAPVKRQPPVVAHGNLDAIRDYTDVRDIVRGYVLALERGESGAVYNLCSGASSSPTMRLVLEGLCALTKKTVVLRQDPERMRPSDVLRLIGDGTRARRELGWTPLIPLATTLEDLLSYWLSTLRATGSKIPETV